MHSYLSRPGYFHKSLTKLKYIRYNITISFQFVLAGEVINHQRSEVGSANSVIPSAWSSPFHKESQAPALVWTARLRN